MTVDGLARTFDEEQDDRFDENGWLVPEAAVSMQSIVALRWYRERFRIGNDNGQALRSYENHYRAARRVKPNPISVQRMQWLADKIALERIRGNWK